MTDNEKLHKLNDEINKLLLEKEKLVLKILELEEEAASLIRSITDKELIPLREAIDSARNNAQKILNSKD